jgi:hypothetical protein
MAKTAKTAGTAAIGVLDGCKAPDDHDTNE